VRFAWDEDKRTANLQKHGLDFVLAERLFDGRPLFTYQSVRNDEVRYVSVGLIDHGRVAALVWTGREDVVRVISLRRARDGEKRAYQDLLG